MQKVCDHVATREKYGKHFTIVVVAEGVHLPPEMKHMTRAIPVGNMVGDAIMLLSKREVRVSVLGYIQRGGSPSPYDRILGTRFGVAAVDLIAQGISARWFVSGTNASTRSTSPRLSAK